ncbi:MAG: hypothetical protein U0835_10265 [Isosphaeraceae bacterium]
MTLDAHATAASATTQAMVMRRILTRALQGRRGGAGRFVPIDVCDGQALERANRARPNAPRTRVALKSRAARKIFSGPRTACLARGGSLERGRASIAADACAG